MLSGVGIIQAFLAQVGKALSFLWDHHWGHWEQALAGFENPCSFNHFSMMWWQQHSWESGNGLSLKDPVGKGSTKNDLKGSADFLVNPTKSPCIQTQSSMSSSKENYTTDSPENLCFSIITHLIQAGSKTKGQTASAPSSYHWQTHIPAGWS